MLETGLLLSHDNKCFFSLKARDKSLFNGYTKQKCFTKSIAAVAAANDIDLFSFEVCAIVAVPYKAL